MAKWSQFKKQLNSLFFLKIELFDPAMVNIDQIKVIVMKKDRVEGELAAVERGVMGMFL